MVTWGNYWQAVDATLSEGFLVIYKTDLPKENSQLNRNSITIFHIRRQETKLSDDKETYPLHMNNWSGMTLQTTTGLLPPSGFAIFLTLYSTCQTTSTGKPEGVRPRNLKNTIKWNKKETPNLNYLRGESGKGCIPILPSITNLCFTWPQPSIPRPSMECSPNRA